jgi:hypothetical protein
VANRGAKTLGCGGKQDSLGKSALVVGVQIQKFRVNDNCDSGAAGCEMSCVRTFDRR